MKELTLLTIPHTVEQQTIKGNRQQTCSFVKWKFCAVIK